MNGDLRGNLFFYTGGDFQLPVSPPLSSQGKYPPDRRRRLKGFLILAGTEPARGHPVTGRAIKYKVEQWPAGAGEAGEASGSLVIFEKM